MPKTIDPLLLLREHIQQNKKIYKDKDYLIFKDNIKLKVDTPTACVQSQTKKQYSLGSLWLYLQHIGDTLAGYIKESQKESIDMVNSLDKESINDFFMKNIDNVEIIDQDLRSKTLIFLGKKKHGERFEKVMEEEMLQMMPSRGKEGGGNVQIITQGEQVSQAREGKEYHVTVKRQRIEDLDPNLRVMEYIYTREKKSLNRNSILKPANPVHSFENLLTICKGIFTKNYSDQRQNETMSFLEELVSGDDLRGNKAIIVVPSNFYEGNLCIENAKQFLLNAQYINLNQVDDKTSLTTINNSFVKKIKGKELVFEICSNINNFTKSDWRRVVAVFVQGFDWEFVEWPKSESITSILLKIKGFHLKYTDLPANDNVKKWNVTILEISRTKRHFDVSVQNDFWTKMEEFLSQPRYREKNAKVG